MLALPGVKKLLNHIEVLKAIVRAKSMAFKKNPVDLKFLMSRRCTVTHTSMAAWWESSPSLEGGHIDVIDLFDEAHATGVTLKQEDRRKSST